MYSIPVISKSYENGFVQNIYSLIIFSYLRGRQSVQ